MWNLSKTPKQALDEAAERGNQLLRKFEAANKAGVRASSHAPAAAKKAAKPAATVPAPKKQ